MTTRARSLAISACLGLGVACAVALPARADMLETARRGEWPTFKRTAGHELLDE